MSTTMRQWVLRANAVYLIVAATGGMIADLAGAFFGRGPQGVVLAAAPHAAIGFVEAHGLALILGVLLWMAAPARSWHFTAVAIHVVLGTSNLVFWPLFSFADIVTVGYVTTVLHWVFVGLQLFAALAPRPRIEPSAAWA